VVQVGGGEHDVLLECPAGAPAGDVARALAEHLGSGADALHVDSARIDPGTPIGSLGLAHGAVVSLGGGGSPEPGAVAAAIACGGTATGTCYLLEEGEYLVGRAPEAALRIDDPALSGEHAWLRVSGSAVAVVDASSRNGTAVEGRRLRPGDERVLAPREIVQLGRTLLRVVPPPQPGAAHGDANGAVAFNRPPRVATAAPPARVVLPQPPEERKRLRIPIGASLIPLVFGAAFWFMTRNPATILFILLAPVLASWNYVEDRIRGGRAGRRATREYEEAKARAEREIAASAEAESAWLRSVAPDAAELLARALERRPTLWERRRTDPDFGLVRVGTAQGVASVEIALDGHGPRGSADEEPEAPALPFAPATISLLRSASVGLAGEPVLMHGVARWVVLQLALLHSPGDVVVAAAVAPANAAGWDCAKWLPHADEALPDLRGPKIVTGAPAAHRLVTEALALAAVRREARAARHAPGQEPFRLVCLIVDEEVAPGRDLVQELVGLDPELRIAVVWIGRDEVALPGGCTAVVAADEGTGRARLTDVREGRVTEQVLLESLSPEAARTLALPLAPLRDSATPHAAGGVPRRASLSGVLGLRAITPEALAARWERRVRGGARAAIGQAADDVVTVDLDADGPHALIAGTTGAGKSELLQTLVAGLASDASPERLAFLLVDYKGGAAFKDCVGLPHTAGLVTDLDDHLALRALESLNAELRRRERVLKEAGAKDLAELTGSAPEQAPPKLVIVIDEFAALAREIPDFVEGVVDIAQRGRSLGVHLVLATQRPAGAVNQNIRANTNIRIALRMADLNESTDVIDAPDAARIPRDTPGRAFARLGHGDLREFQTGFGGTPVAADLETDEIRVGDFGLEEARAPTVIRAIHESATELRAVVEAASGAAAAAGIERPAAPWLPPLPPLLPLAELAPATEGLEEGAAAIGIVDEPRLQRQRPYVVDLQRDGNLLVYGAGGSGKSALLRTVAAAFASTAPPSELAVYGLDMGARGLRLLDALPHTGSIVAGDDLERVERLFRFLSGEIARRRELFAASGAYSLAELRASGRSAPRIIFLLDGYEGFVQAYERLELGRLVDALPRLVSDGPPVGVHVLLSASRRGSVPGALAGLVTQRVILRMASEDEYAMLGIGAKLVRGATLPPGRGFVEDGIEAQLALVGDDPSGEGQAQALRAVGALLEKRHPGERARRVDPMPAEVDAGQLAEPSAPLRAAVGLDEDLATVEVDLADRSLLVAGAYRSGRTSALATLARSLAGEGVRVHLLATRKAPQVEGAWNSVSVGPGECAIRLASLLAEEADGHDVVLIDDAEDITDTASLEELVRRSRTGSRFHLVAAVEKQALRRAFSGWLAELRKDGQVLLLTPDPAADGDLVQLALPRTSGAFPAGRAYLVRNGQAVLVQVAML